MLQRLAIVLALLSVPGSTAAATVCAVVCGPPKKGAVSVLPQSSDTCHETTKAAGSMRLVASEYRACGNHAGMTVTVMGVSQPTGASRVDFLQVTLAAPAAADGWSGGDAGRTPPGPVQSAFVPSLSALRIPLRI